MPRLKDSRGFTLIELLIVVAIIGILAALLIPNLLDALAKAKQKRTMTEMRSGGGAMMNWLTDQVAAAAAGSPAGEADVDMANYPEVSFPELFGMLVPRYIQRLPDVDGWNFPYEYRLDVAQRDEVIMAIRSGGQDGAFSGNIYIPGPFHPTDYNQDLVWTDGFFVRWPQRVGT